MIDKNIHALAKLADHHCILEKGRSSGGKQHRAEGNPDLKSRYLGVANVTKGGMSSGGEQMAHTDNAAVRFVDRILMLAAPKPAFCEVDGKKRTLTYGA